MNEMKNRTTKIAMIDIIIVNIVIYRKTWEKKECADSEYLLTLLEPPIHFAPLYITPIRVFE